MAWLPICGELRRTSNSVKWEPMFVLYYQRSLTEDYRLARKLSRVSGVVIMCFSMRFSNEGQGEIGTIAYLGKEMELNARKKNLFIEKLNGLIPKYKDNVFTVNLYHDGIFICNPLRYVEGDVKQITDVNFDGMTFNDLREIVKRLVHGLVKRLYYCKVGSPLKSIKELKSDSDVDVFLLLGYENRMCVDLYVEHHDYDVLDFLLEETSDPKIVSASSDEYCSNDESEDIDGVDFHTEGDHNVVIKNFTTTDPFLNQLCSNSGSFRGFINDPIPCNKGNVEEDPDGSMRFDHPEQLKICLANYDVAIGYQLWYAKNDWKSILVFCEDIKRGPYSKKPPIRRIQDIRYAVSKTLDILNITVLTTNTPYPSRKIQRICARTHQKTTKET
ncbi:hypothetical protein Tco_0032075 [Tanacetum coccineum]